MDGSDGEGAVRVIGGVIREVRRVRTRAGDPPVSLYRARVGNGPVWCRGATPFCLDGAGADMNDDLAQLKATAEALEHYAAAVVDDTRLKWCRGRDFSNMALDLETLPRCRRSEQGRSNYGLASPSMDREMPWVQALRLSDLRTVWVPAAMVFLRDLGIPREERSWLPSSTGCAAHSTMEEAILGGLVECIERDGAALSWLTHTPLRSVTIDPLARYDSVLTRLVDAIEVSSIKVELFDATSDIGLPIIFALSSGASPDYRRNVVSVACHVDARIAARKALLESVQMQVMLRLAPPAPTDPTDFTRITDGPMFMTDPLRDAAFQFLGTDSTLRLSDVGTACSGGVPAVVRRLAALNIEAYAVDLTTSELIAAGLRAVRVLVPSLQPLSFCPWQQFLDSPRLLMTCARMGVDYEDGLCKLPQPMA